ncbi:MAG: hypothetical protein ACLSFZ_00655 [Frisingicoccus sp.]
MEEMWKLDDAVAGPFFPSGYVIRLGKDQYFWRWEKKRIRCAPFMLARCFKTEAAAKRYADRCFWYEGMEPHICQIRWYITHWLDEQTTELYYWTGTEYTKDLEHAISFTDCDDAYRYQQKNGLFEYTYLDFAPFDLKKLSAAA